MCHCAAADGPVTKHTILHSWTKASNEIVAICLNVKMLIKRIHLWALLNASEKCVSCRWKSIHPRPISRSHQSAMTTSSIISHLEWWVESFPKQFMQISGLVTQQSFQKAKGCGKWETAKLLIALDMKSYTWLSFNTDKFNQQHFISTGGWRALCTFAVLGFLLFLSCLMHR